MSVAVGECLNSCRHEFLGARPSRCEGTHALPFHESHSKSGSLALYDQVLYYTHLYLIWFLAKFLILERALLTPKQATGFPIYGP
jgi:hypothetical protein